MIFQFNIRMIRPNGNESKQIVVDVAVDSFDGLVAAMNSIDHFSGVLQATLDNGKLSPVGPIAINQNAVITARPWKERARRDQGGDEL